MHTFVGETIVIVAFSMLTHLQTVFDFLTRTKTLHEPKALAGHHGGGDTGLASAFVKAVAEQDQRVLGVTPEQILNSHLLVFAAEKARKEGQVVDFERFKEQAIASVSS